MPTVYRITYPNGKIYVGQDRTDTLTYFGSVNDFLVAQDFSMEERHDFAIRKETLWYSPTALRAEVTAKEAEFIRALGANQAKLGYNCWPR